MRHKLAAAVGLPVVSWYETADQVPSWPVAETPYEDRAWMLGWQDVRSEPVKEARFLHVTEGDENCVASLYLISGSQEWALIESDAGMDSVWSGPVVYGPSPYAMYGGFGIASPGMIQKVVEEGLAYTRDTGACALVFPGLREYQASRWLNAVPSGIAVRTPGSHQAPVHGSLEAFQEAIPTTHARREFRRQWRRGDEAGLRLDILPGHEMENMLGQFSQLVESVCIKNGTPGMLGEDVFRIAMGVPGAVMLAARHERQRLAGACLCFARGDTFYGWVVAIDYDTLPELHTYGWLMSEVVRHAATLGIGTVDFGRGNYRYKRRLGFTTIPLSAAVYLTHPDKDLANALTDIGSRISSIESAGDTYHASLAS